MPQSTSAIPSSVSRRPRAAVRTDDRSQLIRGLVNGVVLSLALWLAAGYVAFILH